MAIQASFLVRCLANSLGVTSRIRPPVPERSFPDFVNRIQSMSEKPGRSATLFRGFPEIESEAIVGAGEVLEGSALNFKLS